MEEDTCSTYVSAGDIEKYAYCPMSWKLSHGDAKEQDLHEDISKNIEGIVKKEKAQRNYERMIIVFALVATGAAATALLFLPELSTFQVGVIFGGVSVLWLIFALYFLYRSQKVSSSKDRMYFEKWVVALSMGASIVAVLSFTYAFYDVWLSRVLMVVALLWLLMASFFLHNHLEAIREVRIMREKRRLGKGTITYIDDLNNAPLLVDEELCIRGRPDYIIFRDGEHIPVEEKTGRTPQGPYFSHIMQMAAYIILVQQNMGKSTKGLIKYEYVDHEIVLDGKTKKTFIEIRNRLDDAIRSGIVHRNHNRAGKCKGCSRREDCPENLA